MDFSTGNSGNHLFETVTKIGEGCQQEGAFCQYLGAIVVPKVVAIIPDGYVMEKLERADWRDVNLARKIEELLKTRVWSRPALPSTSEVNWRDCLRKYGVETPAWVSDDTTCLVHGDPTVSNTLLRGHSLVMCDPRPPRDYIPQTVGTDHGRILQSMFGWEAAAYGIRTAVYEHPDFWKDEATRKVAMFWCGAAAARIEHQERRRDCRIHVLDWCRNIRGICRV